MMTFVTVDINIGVSGYFMNWDVQYNPQHFGAHLAQTHHSNKRYSNPPILACEIKQDN